MDSRGSDVLNVGSSKILQYESCSKILRYEQPPTSHTIDSAPEISDIYRLQTCALGTSLWMSVKSWKKCHTLATFEKFLG